MANPPELRLITSFSEIYAAEYSEIEGGPVEATRTPSVADGMKGLALSGGGIRSAAFCLGVLQALNVADWISRLDYMSTVSGGGYIGSSMTVAMSATGAFPFGMADQDVGETDETRHLRDNSKYLLQNGVRSAVSAAVIYLRGIAMNANIVVPLLLMVTAAILAYGLVSQLVAARICQNEACGHWLLSRVAIVLMVTLLLLYAIGVSVFPIVRLRWRRKIATVAAVLFAACLLIPLLDTHVFILRLMSQAVQKKVESQPVSVYFTNISRIVTLLSPLVLAVMPFLRKLTEKAVSDATTRLSQVATKWLSRGVLILVGAIVPLALWLVVMQLTYWGIRSPDAACLQASCTAVSVLDWPNTPPLLADAFVEASKLLPSEWSPLAVYVAIAVGLFLCWPILNVNSNSLHQLYRDRLGTAFLFMAGPGSSGLQNADTVRFSDLPPGKSPYHLVNTALNVPGSSYANRRGRNADFFMFSRLFTGSEATGYVRTKFAEEVTDGLNVGTAMAISGAAAAPNMGMASLRPLSVTIALLNVRLGRWVRHPADIVRYAEAKSNFMKWWRGKPGPRYLLREAFFKSGATIAESGEAAAIGESSSNLGFVFLTDGGHIENLGVYELLKRRCSLIIAVDGEADPEMSFSSLVQLERFARIDLGTSITLNLRAIAGAFCPVSAQDAERRMDCSHVAVGRIDYPPPQGAEIDGKAAIARERGVFIYIKASVNGDENDYVRSYKAKHPTFPQESTMDQLFSEEQFEVYRALGQHITERMITGKDRVAFPARVDSDLVQDARAYFPNLC